MFKSTKNMKSEQFDRMTEDVGGMNNASTSDDYTNYFESVPANHLQRLLWAEAERLSNLNVDEANFKSERAVVQEEYRQSVLSNPYGKLFNALSTLSYTTHPYRRSTIGSIEDLDAASVQDVIDFHKTYYRPDNAVLIVAGNFDQKQLDGWVDQYFAWIPKPATAIPRVTVKEPVRTADKRFTVKSPVAPTPGLLIDWLVPPSNHPDMAALGVASSLLSQGESSRLYQRLVYKEQVALEASAGLDGRVDTGLFYLLAILNAGHTPAEAEAMMLDEVKKLATGEITDAELDKVKTQVLTSRLTRMQSAQGKGMMLGSAVIIEGSAARANASLEEYQRVTAADVQRVLKKYILDGKKVTIDYLPEQAATADKKGGAK
jgi:zinc protease